MSFLNKTGLARLWANILALVNSKVDKVEGKSLSTNDFTDDHKSKLESALTLGDVATITIPEIDAICILPMDPGLYQNEVLTMSWDELLNNGYFLMAPWDSPAEDCLYANESTKTLVGKLVISDDVRTVGERSFQNCTGLTEVVMPNSIVDAQGYVFQNCTSLTKVVLSNNSECNDIANYMFSGCTSLNDIKIPNCVTTIRHRAFEGCTNLITITIPNNGVNIEANAFSGSGLRSIVIPGNCAWTLESQACFAQCKALTTVIIEDGATLIPQWMFYECSALNNVTIPASVTNIGVVAFGACTSLSSITFNGTMAQWNAIQKDYAFEEGTPLAQIICSDGTITL